MLKRFFTHSCAALALCCATLFYAPAYAADEGSPVGFWQSTDEHTNTPKAIIQIYKNADGSLSGKIVKKLVPAGGDTCGNCKGPLHNAPFVGLPILSDMKAVKNTWEGGSIIDPANGQTYHCHMQLFHDKMLEVRGYVGMPMFGRSQIWKRVSAP
ncbi:MULTISPECIES: DUF2147 domain-containing protein [Neokomagataea]|uniref:DUF2147 domain-containing protein n=2 Tax=Neokomagataea TaxID=1223423 RepID=A0ABQ0QJ97_9PROT|nr:MULTISPECIES: DUF2147 domain-containing protein [Neokomagataea]MBR0559901.1 DUF2147 domain-containing protein [Neokomagataea anthophila]GBR46817.1 hypothetical protein AA106556_1241 [Neokomagataea tanensis NBRC 106556]